MLLSPPISSSPGDRRGGGRGEGMDGPSQPVIAQGSIPLGSGTSFCCTLGPMLRSGCTKSDKPGPCAQGAPRLTGGESGGHRQAYNTRREVLQ